MRELIIHNCTSDEIEFSLDDEGKTVKIESYNVLKIPIHSPDNINFTVKEYREENSEKLRLSEVILGFIVSAFLLLINCLNFETVDKSIKLPVNYFLLCSDSDPEIYVNASPEPLKSYSVILNSKTLSGKTVYVQSEIEYQIKEYYKSFLVSLIFPISFFIAFIIASICLKSVISLVVFLIALIIFSIYILKICKKNKEIISDINKHISKENQGTIL